MSANLFEVKINEALEEKGVWCKWPLKKDPKDEDVFFLIGSSKSAAYKATLTKEVRKHGSTNYTRAIETVEGQEQNIEIIISVMAKTVLLGWKGDVIVDQEVGPEPYSYKNAVKALHIRPFREWVEGKSVSEDLFQAYTENAADEAALKSVVRMEPEVSAKLSVP
jgi:hypothetical protein